MQPRSEKKSHAVEKVKHTFPPGKTVFDKDTTISAFLVSFSKLHQFQRTDTFTDVKFSVQGKNLAAHKLILSVHSPVFEAMFSNPMLEATSGQVVIDDVKPRIFEIFITFLYTGIEPKIDQNETVELFVCADKYGVNSLMVTCEKMLCKKMTAKNVMEMYLMAEAYERPALRRRAFQVMGLYMADIVKTEGWNMIQGNTEQLTKIVKYMISRYKQFSNFEFVRPRGRARDLVLGLDEIKTVVIVDRDKMSHLRPHEFRLTLLDVINIYGYVNFIEDKNDKNRIVATVNILELFGSRICETDISIEVSISSQENPDDIIDFRQTTVNWNSDNVHKTMGSPRYIIYEENDKIAELPTTDILFFQITFGTKFSGVDRTRIKYYHFDDGLYKIDKFVSKGSVRITGDNCEWDIPLEVLCERTHSLFGSKDQISVPDTPKETLERLFRIMHLRKTPFGSRILPSRDTVDLHMLKAACKLRMDYDLILYLEHALVWDLDPGNCLDLIEAGTELGLGFLKHGALLYFKVHSDRIIRNFPEHWSRAKPSVLKAILLDVNQNFLQKYSFLPNFLTSSRKPVRQLM